MRIEDTAADKLTNVRFRMQAILNEVESKKQNRPIYNDIEVCEISFPANKQTIGVFPAHEIYGWEEKDEGYGTIRQPITYAMKYNDQYTAFKAGNVQAASGTPLEELPFLSQAKRMELKALKIYTAETLAAIDGQPLKQLGQGGRELKNKAAAYLETAAKTADVSVMKDELAKRDERIAEMEKALEALQGKNAAAPKKSDFDTFENADIINWIKDADPSASVNADTPREVLIAKADEILAVQGKAKAKKAA